MAKRDHSLDGKLLESARREFMEKGFMKASVHTIVKNAGITTGALYTRYENKDALFRSLVGDVMSASAELARPLYSKYMAAKESKDPERMIAVIKEEEKAYRELLFTHYESCILFFVKSDGSSIAEDIERMTRQKAELTVNYLKTLSKSDMDLDGVTMIMTSQFRFYREILEKGWEKEKTVAAMEAVDIYQEAGWKALFSAVL